MSFWFYQIVVSLSVVLLPSARNDSCSLLRKPVITASYQTAVPHLYKTQSRQEVHFPVGYGIELYLSFLFLLLFAFKFLSFVCTVARRFYVLEEDEKIFG